MILIQNRIFKSGDNHELGNCDKIVLVQNGQYDSIFIQEPGSTQEHQDTSLWNSVF